MGIQRIKNSQNIFNKDKTELISHHFKNQCKASVIKTVWHQRKDRNTYQQIRTENPETEPYIHDLN